MVVVVVVSPTSSARGQKAPEHNAKLNYEKLAGIFQRRSHLAGVYLGEPAVTHDGETSSVKFPGN